MIASASAEDYRHAVEILYRDKNIDALIVIFIPPLVTRPADVASSLVQAIEQSDKSKPVLAVFLSAQGAPEQMRSETTKIPCFDFPETAAIALARAARYREWREQPESVPPNLESIRRDEAAGIVASALGHGDGWLSPKETQELLGCYGLPLVEQRIVLTAEEAAQAAEELKGKVALKAFAPSLIHKTEAGAVQLNLEGYEEVKAAALEMTRRLSDHDNKLHGFVVQRMVAKGVEMLVGVVHDPQFGPVVACGAGGVQVELLRDVSVRLTPLSHEDASEMIHNLKTFPLLNGFRGGAVYDVAALEEGLLRVSAMVEDLPQIAELDLNPFVVHEHGATILDGRIRLATVEPRTLLGVRR
jgi:acyl-CoA synthetase (NDP forming)